MYYCFVNNKNYTIREIYDMPIGEVQLLSYFARIEAEERKKAYEGLKIKEEAKWQTIN